MIVSGAMCMQLANPTMAGELEWDSVTVQNKSEFLSKREQFLRTLLCLLFPDKPPVCLAWLNYFILSFQVGVTTIRIIFILRYRRILIS